MDNLIIEETDKTPYVNLNPRSGVCLFKGKSIPEDTFKFYQPISDWFKIYIEEPAPVTTFEIELHYMNTSSTKRILALFNHAKTANSTLKTVLKVIWKYEENDTDTLEIGTDFQKLTNIHFEFVKV